MSKYIDGSDEPATYGQALVWLAENAGYPNGELKREIVRAVQKEHDLVPPEAVPVYADARDQTITAQDARLAELERKLADREAADAAAAQAQRIAELEAKLGEGTEPGSAVEANAVKANASKANASKAK